MAASTDPDRENDVDDQFRALLEGLRTTLPGVQVLMAFLLILPLQGEFATLGTIERGVYYTAFLSAAVSSVLLIAPSVHQRMRSPRTGVERHSRRHLMTAVRLAITGTALLAVALGAAVYLVSSLVYDVTAAAAATAVVAGLVLWAWAYLPLVAFGPQHHSDRLRSPEREQGPAGRRRP
ncbi:MAG: DUF6328 family protein [Acidimicrobiia bacterium]|nr:DUF6328 family protein [Acidimicrobiia bacterium]